MGFHGSHWIGGAALVSEVAAERDVEIDAILEPTILDGNELAAGFEGTSFRFKYRGYIEQAAFV